MNLHYTPPLLDFIWQGEIQGRAQYRVPQLDWTRRHSNYEYLLGEFNQMLKKFAKRSPVYLHITMERTDVTTIICLN